MLPVAVNLYHRVAFSLFLNNAEVHATRALLTHQVFYDLWIQDCVCLW